MYMHVRTYVGALCMVVQANIIVEPSHQVVYVLSLHFTHVIFPINNYKQLHPSFHAYLVVWVALMVTFIVDVINTHSVCILSVYASFDYSKCAHAVLNLKLASTVKCTIIMHDHLPT